MGAGNYRHARGRTVFTELETDEADEFVVMQSYECVLDAIEAAISGTAFVSPLEVEWRRERNGGRIAASNDLYDVWLNEDDYGRVAITYGLGDRIPDGMEGLAESLLDRRAAAFFDRLQQDIDLSVATSPWTSAPRELHSRQAA